MKTNYEHVQEATFHVREAREIAAGIRDVRAAAAVQSLVDAVEHLLAVVAKISVEQ